MNNKNLVSILFAEKNGIYSHFHDVDIWHIKKDARLYNGPHPVVAHPPCQLWGKFAKINYHRWGGKHNKPGNDGGCFKAALDFIRKFKGVLEHPAYSYAWKEYNLTKPSKNGWLQVDENEWTCEVWQSAYGHLARKKTWLYYVGYKPHELNWSKHPGSHQIGFYDQRGKEKNKPTLSGKKASATPILFAEELIKLARQASKEIKE